MESFDANHFNLVFHLTVHNEHPSRSVTRGHVLVNVPECPESVPISLFHVFCPYKCSAHNCTRDPNFHTFHTLKPLSDSECTFLNDKWTFCAIIWQLHCPWNFYCICFYFYKEVWDKKEMNALPPVISGTVSRTFVTGTKMKSTRPPEWGWSRAAITSPLNSSVHWHPIVREKDSVKEHEQYCKYVLSETGYKERYN